MADKFKPCAVSGCNRNASTTAGGRCGLCGAHYRRKRIHGDPLGGPPPRTAAGEPLAWLQRHVVYSCDDCLIWPYSKSSTGRAVIYFRGASTTAHRVMCVLAHGEPPAPQLDAAHSCGNGHLGCVNPRHLRWATRRENTEDSAEHGTMARGEHFPRARLRDADVEEIFRQLATETNKDIAARFGIDPSYVSQIRHGKRRAWMKT